jgi:2-polyprenyl-6-methoxyphenol hydroxylase-like FAD-dependent oxidoreductase
MPRLKVLIIGGGIAGNALAFWLSKLGHDITVIERFSSLRATGLQVDLRGHGIEVLKYMGLEQAFRSKAASEQGIQMVDSTGKRRGYFPANKSGRGAQSFTSEFEIMRGDLCRIIYDATKDRAKYIFGTSVESVEEKDGAVHVSFADGKRDKFDLLVGADGQWSRTRKTMFANDMTDGFVPLNGMCVAYFTMPRPIREGEEYIATSYIAPGRRGIMTRRSNAKELQIYIGGTTSSERLKNARKGDVKEEKAALTEFFKGAGWETEEIVKAVQDADDFYCERLGLVKLKSWSKGRLVLVGDSAYCSSANSGMGTTSAVVGAYVLAGEIGKHCGRFHKADRIEDSGTKDDTVDQGNDATGELVTALQAYEQKFKPFMYQVQKGMDEEDTKWDSIVWSSFGISVIHRVVGLASFLKINIGKYMLREDVKGWTLPEYEEMQQDCSR